MKFQNPSLNFFFERTEGRTNEPTHKPKPICSPLFQSWGHKKQVRVSASRSFLRKVECESTFLFRIITTDETWVHYYEPENKQMSMVWKNHNSPQPKKAKAIKSMGKVMCIVFLDIRGVVLVHMVKSGRTVNADYYSKVNYFT